MEASEEHTHGRGRAREPVAPWGGELQKASDLRATSKSKLKALRPGRIPHQQGTRGNSLGHTGEDGTILPLER